MDGLEGAVLDVEQVETQVGDDGSGASDNAHEGAGGQQPTEYDPFESKSARELSAWLKAKRDSGDPLDAKAAKALKDIFGQSYAFKKEFPDGLDSARSVKALVDSVIHQGADGKELKGAEAIAALQDSVREYGEYDRRIAAGDGTVLESFDDAMKAGVVKMAPAILDMAKQSDPEGYVAALTPHVVDALSSGGMIASLANLIDALNEEPPKWMTPNQKTDWVQEKFAKVGLHSNKMVNIWNGLLDKGKTQTGQSGTSQRTATKDPISERETALDNRERDAHWNTNIAPKLDQHADTQFRALFAPYAKRLNLDAPTTNALKEEFAKRVASTAVKDAAYIGQIGRYRAMKNPDPATVLNYAKVNFDKHAKNVMEALVNERYKPFLNGKPRGGQPGNQNGAGPKPSRGVEFVTVRPAEGTYDPRTRTLDQIHAKIYPLLNGRTVQYRPNGA